MLYDLSLNPTILFDFVSILEQQGHKQLKKDLQHFLFGLWMSNWNSSIIDIFSSELLELMGLSGE